jgi:ABC-type multidrug transport system fused ATPase/permease subunit
VNVLRRLFRFLLPYRNTILISTLLLLGLAGIELVPPLLQREIIDGVIGEEGLGLLGSLITGTTRGENLRSLGILVAAMVGAYALKQLFRGADLYLRHALGERLILDLRVRIYAYLQRLSLSFFEGTSTGELMSRVTNDVNALESFVTHGSALAGVSLLRLVGSATILFILNWRLALLVLIPVPILAVALRYFNTRIRPIYRRVRDRLGDINARLQDSLSGIQVIQAFGQEDRELERFSTESQNYYEARVRGIRYWSTFFPGMGFIASLGTVAVLGFGAAMVIRQELTLGTLVAFLSYVTSFYDPINRLTEIDNVFQQTIAAGERIFELLDAPSEVADAPDAIPLPSEEGAVAFEHVRFRYGTGEDVLHDVTFEMAPGEAVALVGPSGAGKTSIANLLCRFYDPIDGRITINGHDLRKIQLDTLRSQVSVVLQDTFLFNTTVRENLLYGKPDATEEELVAAAQAAYAHEFIVDLPDGYDTEIGERGVRLSGGQKQRLALARAILADPRILILDEATSSVDAEAEYLIQQALESVLEGRTALVIAHRLSTIRGADKIIALEEGNIIEVGDHEELIHRGGLYSQLYRRQVELSAMDDTEPRD